MDSAGRNVVSGGRAVVKGLRGLGEVAAPSSLLGGVLAEIGLADAYWVVESPLGPVYVAYNSRGISAVMPMKEGQSFEEVFRARFHRRALPVDRPPMSMARRVDQQLRNGNVRDLDYDLAGLTEFERAVLLKALEIPRGEVRPYGWIAREIGRPGAVRAVGTALANNPVPLLIPCHRVVKSDGRVGNYAFGPDAKRVILANEGVQLEELERLVAEGVRYFGSDTTGIYCFPTCRHARRVTDRHRVTFSSAIAATSAGYRPCRVCRPPLPAGEAPAS